MNRPTPAVRALVPAIAAGAIALTVAPGWAQWSMFHGDRRHSGYADVLSPSGDAVAWSHVTSDSIWYSSPVVGPDGTIYVANLAGDLMALRDAGNVRWTLSGLGSFRYSTPAVASDGTIYIGSSDGRLYAVNPGGTIRWTFTAGSPIKTSPNIATDGTIYFGADNGKLYAVRPDSTLRWTYQTADTIRSSPAIGPDGTIFFGSEDFYFYALDPTGTLRWRAATGNVIKLCSPAVSSAGIVYFGSYDGYLYALTSAGGLKWAKYTGHVIRSSPVIANNMVYVGVDSDLVAYNANNGQMRWKYQTGADIYGSPAFTGRDSLVYVGSDDGTLYAIHANGQANDGQKAWDYTVGKPIRSTPAPTGAGNIVLGDLGGKVWAFGPLSTVSVPEEDPRAPIAWARPNPSSGPVRFARGRDDGANRRLFIYDAWGRQVTALSREAGDSYWWDGLDRKRRRVLPGVYFYRLEGQAATGRLVRLR